MVKKRKSAKPPLAQWADSLAETLKRLPPAGHAGLSPPSARAIRTTLSEAHSKLSELISDLNPARQPRTVFDPAHPEIVGKFVAMALLAQPRVPLDKVERFYGSGIYAIYYQGAFDAYAPLAGKEHPIYVGKADPEVRSARNPIEQGEKLSDRLRLDHRRSIARAANLRLPDFECRYLVVASGWQEPAESYLIHLYKPVWNSETRICYGIGKHGDSADTRANRRSPWDTMHAGRSWARKGRNVLDAIPEPEIRQRLAEHFRTHPPLGTREDAFTTLLAEMSQS